MNKKGGARPQAHIRPATNCRAALGHIDRRIVAWAEAQGHRHRPVDNLKYFLSRHISNTLLWEIVGCQINNNGGDYGITIRLHSLGHRRMDRGATRLSCKLLLDPVGYRHGNSYEGKPGRGYFSDYVSSRIRSWNMDEKIFFDGGQRYGSWNERLQMQCRFLPKIQIYQKMGEGYRKLVRRKVNESR